MLGSKSLQIEIFEIDGKFSPVIIYNGIKENRKYPFSRIKKDTKAEAIEFVTNVIDNFKTSGYTIDNDSDWKKATEFYEGCNK